MLKLLFIGLLIALIIPSPARITSLAPQTATPPNFTQTSISIPISENAKLKGTLYEPLKTSDVLVIFSTTGEGKQRDWAVMAEDTAQHGYRALTYDFRFWISTTRRDPALFDKVADDLQAVIDFATAQGAKRIILIGASLGGMATAKLGAAKGVVGVVIISSPMSANGLNLRVTPEELRAITAPKLFIASQDDKLVTAAATREMFELAAEPKHFILYSGSAHGTDIFKTDDAADLTTQLRDFIVTNATTPIKPTPASTSVK